MERTFNYRYSLLRIPDGTYVYFPAFRKARKLNEEFSGDPQSQADFELNELLAEVTEYPQDIGVIGSITLTKKYLRMRGLIPESHFVSHGIASCRREI